MHRIAVTVLALGVVCATAAPVPFVDIPNSPYPVTPSNSTDGINEMVFVPVINEDIPAVRTRETSPPVNTGVLPVISEDVPVVVAADTDDFHILSVVNAKYIVTEDTPPAANSGPHSITPRQGPDFVNRPDGETSTAPGALDSVERDGEAVLVKKMKIYLEVPAVNVGAPKTSA